jgi:sec-independent protein translocase protein TatA
MGFLGEPTHWILILLLLLVLFGYKRLPEMGKGLGEGLKGFKDGLKGASDTPAAPTAQQTAASAPPASHCRKSRNGICHLQPLWEQI